MKEGYKIGRVGIVEGFEDVLQPRFTKEGNEFY